MWGRTDRKALSGGWAWQEGIRSVPGAGLEVDEVSKP